MQQVSTIGWVDFSSDDRNRVPLVTAPLNQSVLKNEVASTPAKTSH